MKKRTILISFIFVITIILDFSIVLFALSNNNHFSSEEKLKLEVEILGFDLDSPGDCILINYNNTQILIDSCQADGNFNNKIKPKMQEMMINDNDKIWEYIIFTHPDMDHIGNALNIFSMFYGSDGWSIGNIIDFDFLTGELDTNKIAFKESFYTLTAQTYIATRNLLVSTHGINYFSASSLTSNSKIMQYSIDSNVKLDILYNYYCNYDVLTQLMKKSSSGVNLNDGEDNESDSKGVYKNIISVCTLIEYYDEKLLFTGDLPDTGNNCDGETKLMENHPELLKNVTLFKAGHHGSLTSNSEKFIDYIRPAYVSITKGPTKTDGYPRYPNNVVLNNFLKYTDYITISKVVDGDKKYALYGDVKYIFKEDITIQSQYNNGTTIREANFIENGMDSGLNFFEERLWHNSSDLRSKDSYLYDTISVYFLNDNRNNDYNTCTLIKYGHIDILIDCGSENANSNYYVKELNNYGRDGVIEYLIVSHHQFSATSQIAGHTEKYQNKDGILNDYKVINLIDGAETNLDNPDALNYKAYKASVKENINDENYFTIEYSQDKDFVVADNLTMRIMGSGIKASTDENEYSLSTLITFRNQKFLFVGDLLNYSNIISRNESLLKDLALLRISTSTVNVINDGTNVAYDDYKSYIDTFNAKKAILMMLSINKFSTEIQEDEWYKFILKSFKSNNKSNVYINEKTDNSYNILYEYSYNKDDANDNVILYRYESNEIISLSPVLLDEYIKSLEK